jgi:transcriptional regulator with XRE-family HTH domain
MTTQPYEGRLVELWELEFTFGDRMRKARRALGLTVEQFAAGLGMKKQLVSQWETGVSNPRSASSIAWRVEGIYGIPAWWLLGNDEPPAGDGEGPDGVRRQGLEPRTRYISASASQDGIAQIFPADSNLEATDSGSEYRADVVQLPTWLNQPGVVRDTKAVR